MAPKRPPPIADPPASSSDESEDTDDMKEDQAQKHDEDNVESEEDEVSEEEGSEDEEEEEEEADEENNSEIHSEGTQPSPTASDYTVKPIVSKPMDDQPKSNKPAPNPAVPASKTAVKRTLNESEKNGNGSQKKKSKVVSSGNGEGAVEEKKSATRLWGEEDEIVVLKGMIEYQSKKGADTSADMGAFHEFIKKSLQADVTKNQLTEKVRRLKRKYQINAEKGEDPVFSKPHENKSFQLSKKIWGGGGPSNGVAADSSQSNNKARKSVKVNSLGSLPKETGQVVAEPEGSKGKGKDVKVEKEDFWSMYPCLEAALELENSPYSSLSQAEKNFVKERISRIGGVKAKELEDNWKKLRVDELALFLKRVELICDQTKLMSDAMKVTMT